MFKAKKVLSLFLAIAMLTTSFVLPVSADSQNTAETAATEALSTDAITETAANKTNVTVAAPATPVSQSTPAVATARKTIVEIDHGHTVKEVVAMIQNHPHSGFDSYKVTAYDEVPSFSAPYRAGSLAKTDIDDAENAMKIVRFLAGVPYKDVAFSDELNNIAQHGSVLLAASNQFSHTPTQLDDMNDDFFSLGYQGCSEANISAGRSNISSSVLGFMYDAGANNIMRAGHRRWILNPGNQEFGIGYADGPDASYGGHRINMYVFAGLGYWECESDSYIAWPSDGAFPIQYLAADEYIDTVIDCPWSINLGSPYAAPEKESLTLKLTRVRDGKTWTFDKDTPNLGNEGLSDSKLHLTTDNSGYGITKAIIFRPDPDSLGAIQDGDIFKVELSGITYTDGTPTTLSYDINFFDLDKAVNGANVTFAVKNNDTPLIDAAVTIDGQTVTTDTNGQVTISLEKGQSYEYHVTKEGYTESTGKITVDGSSTTKEVTLKRIVSFTVKGTLVPYNGNPQAVDITLDPMVDYTVTYNGSSDIPVNAGDYDVIVTVNEEGYSGQAAKKMTITQAELEIAADAKVKKLGSEDPKLTYTIVSGQLYGNDTLTGKLTRTSGEKTGIYEIQQGTLQANSNYKLTFVPASFVITDKSGTLPWNNPFTDVYEHDWYYKSVEYVHKNSLFSGLTATQFGPNVPVTRGMLVTVLYRAEGKPEVLTGSQFEDVAAGAYYEKAVTWAEQNGIVSGYSETFFAPDAPILREQIAAIFYRYARFKGLAVDDTDYAALDFQDAHDISSYAVKSIQYCVSKNIMYGRTTDIFKPLDYATRAEMAAILLRFLSEIQSAEL